MPTISVVIPTFNEEKNIGRCLESIFRQSYPHDKLEVIVVDDKSTDKTVEIARRFPVKVIVSGKKHGEISKMIGFKKATGEFAIYLDADVELIGKSWFQKMLKPFLNDQNIIGSFTRYYSDEHSSPVERYLNFDPLQRDSIYQFFSPSIKSTIVEEKEGYYICEYRENKIPPAGLCLYRKKVLLELVSGYEMFLDLDFLVVLVRDGFNKFAYVPKAGLYHHHASSLGELVRKRLYNLQRVYLAREERLYKWFNLKNPRDLAKIASWVIYANLVIPPFLIGIYKSLKYRDWVGLYEPVINLLVTDVLVISALASTENRKALFGK